jgi:hypothetical protein
MAQLIGNERVDDIPLLLHQMQKVNLSGLLDEHFTGDGNWQGISMALPDFPWRTLNMGSGSGLKGPRPDETADTPGYQGSSAERCGKCQKSRNIDALALSPDC